MRFPEGRAGAMDTAVGGGLIATLLSAALVLAPRVEAAAEAPCGSLDVLRSRLSAAAGATERSAVAGAFAACAERETTPLLFRGAAKGSVRVLFVFRSASERVFLAGDVNGWSTSSHPLE